ncbi:MAG: NAD(P)-dependent alcohol dehydrogenase [bacterium]|nr:NAD(P)-dependent alcohol dehydrogenase [Acidimicrobiia bacterium]MCY4651062.1 NAD(P)-dependent alcohol dehydrogenase [bacterium]
MRAAVLHPEGGLEIEERPVPEPGPDEVLVAPKLVGICGSDLHYYKEGRIGDWRVTEPHVLGHEFSAVVEQAGPHTDTLPVGTPVAVEPIVPCRECDACHGGLYNLCASFGFTGSPHTDGALQESVVVPAQGLHPLPPDMPFEMGALVEPTSIAVHAVRRSELQIGETVTIIGAGPIGLLILAVCRAHGAGDVYVTDIDPGRLQIAEALGATATVDVRGMAPDEIRRHTRQQGTDITFEAVGSPTTLETAIHLVRPSGRVIAVGVNIAEHIPFNLMLAQSREATVIPIYLGRDAFAEAIELLASAKIDGRRIVSHRFPLEKAAQAMDTALGGGEAVKVLIEVNQ